MVNDRRARVFVLGGGVAGLTAAFGLADHGHVVTLIESRRQCGGRAFASTDQVTGERLDNGAHVQLGCYRAMRRLLARLGTDRLFQQDRRLALRHRFVGGAVTGLALSRLPVPLAMPWAMLRLGLPWSARFAALRGMVAVLFGARRGETLAAWLLRRGQGGLPAEVLWRPLCCAIMNVEPELASAEVFLRTLREAFLGSASSAAFWLPRASWSEILGDAAPAALRAAGIELRTGVRVEGIEVANGRVGALRCDGARTEVGAADHVVSALPWFALRRLWPPDREPAAWVGLRSSPIVTTYFRLTDGALPDDGPVVALVGGEPFHFVLRRPGEPAGHFALLSGGDRSFDGMSIDAIAAVARAQLGRYYPGLRLDGVVRVRKEQHATFIDGPDDAARRPAPGRLDVLADNLWVCGDWTRTGLPATLEGAARSAERLVATFARERSRAHPQASS